VAGDLASEWRTPAWVAAQLGHASPTTTLATYAHLFDRTKQTDELRDRLSAGFGHLFTPAASQSS